MTSICQSLKTIIICPKIFRLSDPIILPPISRFSISDYQIWSNPRKSRPSRKTTTGHTHTWAAVCTCRISAGKKSHFLRQEDASFPRPQNAFSTQILLKIRDNLWTILSPSHDYCSTSYRSWVWLHILAYSSGFRVCRSLTLVDGFHIQSLTSDQATLQHYTNDKTSCHHPRIRNIRKLVHEIEFPWQIHKKNHQFCNNCPIRHKILRLEIHQV